MQKIKNNFFDKVESILLYEKVPSKKLEDLFLRGNEITYPFNLIKKLTEIEQNPIYHPEGSVFKHVMLVVNMAAKVKNISSNSRVFMWAALLHDLGKSTTTKIRKGRLTSYNHEKEGKKMAITFLEESTLSKDEKEKIIALVRWHMEPFFVNKKLPFSNLKEMLVEINPFDIALLSFCDRLGRGELTKEKQKEELNACEKFLEICKNEQISLSDKVKIEEGIEVLKKQINYENYSSINSK